MTKDDPQFYEFFDAYIEAALWSSNDDEGEPLDSNYSYDDIDEQTRLNLMDECFDFIQYCERIGINPIPEYNKEWTDAEMSGHDFWLTRNGHGAGYWDRGLGELGDKLSDATKTFGSCDLYVGDNGKIYAQ
jgi:hypothetical protein